MEISNWRKYIFKPLGVFVILMRHITSWYVVPIWAFCLPYFLGDQSFYLSAIMAIFMGLGSYKLWEDYEPLDDGQITVDELKKSVKDDLSK